MKRSYRSHLVWRTCPDCNRPFHHETQQVCISCRRRQAALAEMPVSPFDDAATACELLASAMVTLADVIEEDLAEVLLPKPVSSRLYSAVDELQSAGEMYEEAFTRVARIIEALPKAMAAK